MNVARTLREARRRAKLTQAVLAQRAGTSQPAIAAYERGAKQPSVETLDRILLAAGARLSVEPVERAVVIPSAEVLKKRGETLVQVMLLAEALPYKPRPLGRPLKERINAAS